MNITLTIPWELSEAIMRKGCPLHGAKQDDKTGNIIIDASDDVYRERILHVIADLGVTSIGMHL